GRELGLLDERGLLGLCRGLLTGLGLGDVHGSYFPDGIRYTTVKITIHTMSTKCQYKPTSSTVSARSTGSRPSSDIPYSDRSIRIPMVTCAPWNPVRVKKVEPNRF